MTPVEFRSGSAHKESVRTDRRRHERAEQGVGNFRIFRSVAHVTCNQSAYRRGTEVMASQGFVRAVFEGLANLEKTDCSILSMTVPATLAVIGSHLIHG